MVARSEQGQGRRNDLRDSEEALALSRDISEAVLARLGEQGVTQAELARRLGMSRAQLGRLVSGATNPTLRTVVDLLASVGLRLAIVPVGRQRRARSQQEVPGSPRES